MRCDADRARRTVRASARSPLPVPHRRARHRAAVTHPGQSIPHPRQRRRRSHMRNARKFTAMAAGLAVASLALAACSSGDSGDDTTSGNGEEVEVFTWWASGSEKLGLDALVSVFDVQHPDIEFVNGAVAGGAGSAAKDLLPVPPAGQRPAGHVPGPRGRRADRLHQRRPGRGRLGPLRRVRSARRVPGRPGRRLTVDGKIYSIPSNIHRANVVWANTQLLTDAGLDPAATYATLDDWFVALDAVKEKTGRTPLSLATTWTQVNLLRDDPALRPRCRGLQRPVGRVDRLVQRRGRPTRSTDFEQAHQLHQRRP